MLRKEIRESSIWNDIEYETVLAKKLESNCWCVTVEVKEKLYKGVIMIIYHSSSASRGFYEIFRGYSRGANNKGRMHGNKRF